MNWIKTETRLPQGGDEPYARPYRVLVRCVEICKEGNDKGRHVVRVVRDWVVRFYPEKFTHWLKIEELD